MLRNSIGLVVVVMLLGNLELSAAGVDLSVISNFSFGFLLRMGSALEMLCAVDRVDSCRLRLVDFCSFLQEVR